MILSWISTLHRNYPQLPRRYGAHVLEWPPADRLKNVVSSRNGELNEVKWKFYYLNLDKLVSICKNCWFLQELLGKNSRYIELKEQVSSYFGTTLWDLDEES